MSRSPPPYDSLESLIADLSLDPDREPVASEAGVLQSIYGDDALRLWRPSSPREHERTHTDYEPRSGESGTIRYEVTLSVCPPSEPDTTYPITILVSLPPGYPASTPPQLQLLSRYLGPLWTSGAVCVFDGLERVREACEKWVGDRLSAVKIGELVREDGRPGQEEGAQERRSEHHEEDVHVPMHVEIPAGVEIVESEPIVDRKSVFIGRACKITDPSQVQIILAHLMSDRRIARAAHPIINAWRCRVGNILHQDNDDDGETAAGGRLSHLLQILDVDNVLVIVTRYFGGIHLGPDRFKHINQAARNSLELGGFLDVPDHTDGGRRKGKSGHTGGKR
ncbi:ribosomal protein S5 domain 2-type protein [Amylocystis lapponica]|nr:ribosomal protein S5 domain 2-type protein [Amylocystis lapponica]